MVWNVLLFDLILVVQSSQSSILTLSPNFSYHHHPHLHSHHHPHPHPPHHYQNYNHNWTRPNDISLSSSISADASSTTQFQFQAIAQPLIKAAAAAIDPNSELRLFNFNWDSVKKYLIITTFLLIAIVIKILHANIRLFHTYLPESCLLICCGIFIGFLKSHVLYNFYLPQFSIEIFFYLLIPPIMLEAAFSLHDKVFFENLGTILSYAVLGTLINVILISGSLYAVSFTGLYHPDQMTLIEFVVFSIIISAIDPVAVLTIFEEINVNKDIYFLVFGESLLNDAVVITLYNTVVTLKSFANLNGSQIGLALSSFMVVSFGGAFCGLILGLSSSVAAKYCRRVRVVEPLLMLVFAYFSYVIGELFHMSGIISLICCGLAQAQFARLNISRKSFITVRYITKTLSALADNVIFIFLGMLLVQQTHQFNPGFFSTSFLFAVIHRFVSIYLLSYLSNRLYRRARVIRPNEQFLMAYGGLRGAIAFSLAFSMPPFLVHRQLLTSSTLQLVVASVFLFGCTMKPLVRYLRISSNTTPELSLLECMNRRVQLYTLAGIENLIGQKSFNAYAERYVRLNERRLRPMLVNSSAMHNQLAVELRFMLEQLYVKHTNPHTEIPPPPHSPGNAVRFIGQTLFQRVRRLSSMRRSSGSSSDRRNKNAKRRPTDEAIALQRSQREEGTLDAFASRRSRRSAGESPLFCTPIRMPVPPPPPRIPSPPPTKKADKRNDSNKSTKSRKGDKSDKSCTNNNEHRVQIETIGGSQYQSKPPKPIMRQSQNQLTVPGAPSVSITNVDEPATVAHWQSIPELQILQIPVLDEATGVWITHGQRHSLEGDVIGAHRLLTGSGSTGSQLGSYLHSHHHQLRRASLQATNAANERQLVKTRLSSLPIATMNVRLATLGSSEPTQQTREAASMMAARYRRNARLRSEGRSQHMQRHVVVPSQFGLGNRSIRRKAKASQYTVYNHVNEWDRTNSMKQTDDHRLISIADTHARSHSADSIGKPRF